MKKTLLTFAFILTMALGASAQGGLFKYGAVSDESYYGSARQDNGGLLSLPTTHGNTDDVNAPLGSGLAILAGLGGGYLLAKRRKDHLTLFR